MNFISENKAKLLHFYRYSETYNTCNALIAVFVLRARSAAAKQRSDPPCVTKTPLQCLI